MATPEKGAPPTEQQTADAKRKADFFIAVRRRGVLNTMLDGPSEAFDAANPGWRSKWEFCPPRPNGFDNTFVVAREAMGFRLVDASELGDLTASEQTEGPVRRGDLVLMAAPEEVMEAIEMEDARIAWEDQKLPEITYRKHLEEIAVRTRGGEIVRPRAVGKVERTTETAAIPDAGVAGHEVERT